MARPAFDEDASRLNRARAEEALYCMVGEKKTRWRSFLALVHASAGHGAQDCVAVLADTGRLARHLDAAEAGAAACVSSTRICALDRRPARLCCEGSRAGRQWQG